MVKEKIIRRKTGAGRREERESGSGRDARRAQSKSKNMKRAVKSPHTQTHTRLDLGRPGGAAPETAPRRARSKQRGRLTTFLLLAATAGLPASAASRWPSSQSGYRRQSTSSLLLRLLPLSLYRGVGTGHAAAPQISSAYSWIVRSVENFPLPATLMIDMRSHVFLSRYAASTRSCAARYDGKSLASR